MQTGIETIAYATPETYLDLKVLADRRGVDPEKYLSGIGQEKMAVPAPDEDVVTLAAQAAQQALADTDPASLDTLMVATESGIDQSKAAAIYVHRLLGLPSHCKAVELKQACCSSTSGLQLALALVAQKPKKKVLLVASDIARYGLGTPGEPTQGAGAVAMVISAQPRVVAFEAENGSYTEDVMDFWRPNYLDEALVDGKFSIKIYLKALSESWKYYVRESGRCFEDFDHFCYHMPFTKMAEKAHQHLAKLNRSDASKEALHLQIRDSLQYNRLTGNCYTASLYEGLLSLLNHHPEDLTDKQIGLFSYGSGCMATFFAGKVLAGYQNTSNADFHRQMLDARRALSYEEYETYYRHALPSDGSRFENPRRTGGDFRLAGIDHHQRLYEACTDCSDAKSTQTKQSLAVV